MCEFLPVQRDRVAQFFKESLGHLLGLTGQASDLAQQGLLLGVQVFGDDHLHQHVLVTPPAATYIGHALAGEPKRLSVLRSGRDGDLHRAVQGRNLDPVAEGRLDHVDAELVNDALVAPRQVRVRLDAQHHIQVAWRPAPGAGLALAADADLRTGVHTGRYPHSEPAGDGGATLPSALRAWVLQEPARAAARWAGDLRHDRAEDRLLGAPDLPRAATAWARIRAGARLRAAPGTAIAGREARDVDLLFDSGERLLERNRHVVAEVVSSIRPLPPRAPAAAEERVEDVGKRHV